MTIGIYEIYNIKNHKRYIGSSINIERRWNEHLRSLNSNTHHSIKLQRAWNKANDKEIFKTNILQIYDGNDINELFELEQKYIDKYDSFYNGYNCAMVNNPNFMNTVKNNKKKENNIKNDKYFNYCLELFDIYEDNIEISKTYKTRIFDKHYKYNTYNKIILLILEYEKYFTNDYYIRLFNNNFWINSNDNKITYEYIFKNNKINRYNVYYKCILIDNKEDRKQYEYK